MTDVKTLTYVKTSPIHGLGLFAAERIPAGTVIGKLEGYLTDQDGPYVLWIEDDRGLHVTNDLKYINHSKDANAVYYDDLTVGALRDIEPDEEITHNYGGDDEDAEIDFDH